MCALLGTHVPYITILAFAASNTGEQLYDVLPLVHVFAVLQQCLAAPVTTTRKKSLLALTSHTSLARILSDLLMLYLQFEAKSCCSFYLTQATPLTQALSQGLRKLNQELL